MSPRPRFVLASAFLGVMALVLPLPAQVAAPADPLAGLRPDPPRLILLPARLAELQAQARSDAALRRYVDDVLAQARKDLDRPALRYEKIGPRLLSVSRECLRRIYGLGLAWRWTGEKPFLESAVANLRTVAAFPDWNPSHFLDVAEMTHAVAVGYDWLRGAMDPADRETLRAALVSHGLEPGVAAYGPKPAWWSRSEFNWNQVCNSGLLIGALALADTDPRFAREILPKAIASLPLALKSYAPDGAWMEGPGYWDYATRYVAYGLAALDSALGHDFGLHRTAGLDRAGWFPLLTTGPTGLLYNFADAGENARRAPTGCLFWLARIYSEPAFADADHVLLRNAKATPEHVIWYLAPSPESVPPKDLDTLLRGGVPVATLRSSWSDPDALFVAVKGGYNQVNHGHLDLGSFVLDALGVRWALDLGADDYNLPGYWEGRRGGRRWSYFRINSQSHNLCRLGDEDQDPEGRASVTKFQADGGRAAVVLDLTSAYRPKATRAARGIALVAARHAVLVQDEFDLPEATSVTWSLVTAAAINVETRGPATLEQKGRRLVARILAPPAAEFSITSAERSPPEKPNKGLHRLELKVSASPGPVTIAVLLSAESPNAAPARPPASRALIDW